MIIGKDERKEGLRFEGSRSRFSYTVTMLDAILGSFSIDDGNGSENVSLKINSRFFNTCGIYSNLLKMASVGEFPWS